MVEAGGKILKNLLVGENAAEFADQREGCYWPFCRVFPFYQEGSITFAGFKPDFSGFSKGDAHFPALASLAWVSCVPSRWTIDNFYIEKGHTIWQSN